ncbi:hypothetical protein HK105_208600 [Polyrhizophydium stewartii]|uniref:Uncharacterized protein n=1 Tax=Polyrhizophydium stewartii TaxID=2732419 RepID=A0ABR4MXD5_9FUNG
MAGALVFVLSNTGVFFVAKIDAVEFEPLPAAALPPLPPDALDALDAPDSDAPDSDAPDSDAPDSDAPDSDAPDSDAPDSDAPDSDAPDSDAADLAAAGRQLEEQRTSAEAPEPDAVSDGPAPADDSLRFSLLVPMDEHSAAIFSSARQQGPLLTADTAAAAVAAAAAAADALATPPLSPPKDAPSLSSSISAIAARRRRYRERNWDMMKDLSGLMQLLSAKNDELLSQHSLLAASGLAPPAQAFLDHKADYIHTARDIYDISSNIVASWKPSAAACSNSHIASDLARALTKVEALSLQLRTVTSRKENDPTDRDTEAQVLSCASNLVDAAQGALRGLEAAQLRLAGDDDDDHDDAASDATSRSASALSAAAAAAGAPSVMLTRR